MSPLLPLLGLLSLQACHGSERFPTAEILIKGQKIKVEVADNEDERSLGLMYRDSLPADKGMLFVYPDTHLRSFWMANTRIPLSIAFLDGSGRVVTLTDMKPLDRERTSSVLPARYALEMNQGWFASHGVAVGDTVEGLQNIEEP